MSSKGDDDDDGDADDGVDDGDDDGDNSKIIVIVMVFTVVKLLSLITQGNVCANQNSH